MCRHYRAFISLYHLKPSQNFSEKIFFNWQNIKRNFNMAAVDASFYMHFAYMRNAYKKIHLQKLYALVIYEITSAYILYFTELFKNTLSRKKN